MKVCEIAVRVLSSPFPCGSQKVRRQTSTLRQAIERIFSGEPDWTKKRDLRCWQQRLAENLARPLFSETWWLTSPMSLRLPISLSVPSRKREPIPQICDKYREKQKEKKKQPCKKQTIWAEKTKKILIYILKRGKRRYFRHETKTEQSKKRNIQRETK